MERWKFWVYLPHGETENFPALGIQALTLTNGVNLLQVLQLCPMRIAKVLYPTYLIPSFLQSRKVLGLELLNTMEGFLLAGKISRFPLDSGQTTS